LWRVNQYKFRQFLLLSIKQNVNSDLRNRHEW
jgi:hypothetical protein